MVLDNFLRGRERLQTTLDYTKTVSAKASHARREILKSGSCLKNTTVHIRTSNWSTVIWWKTTGKKCTNKYQVCLWTEKVYAVLQHMMVYREMTGKEATHFHDVTSVIVEQFSNWGLTSQEGREIVHREIVIHCWRRTRIGEGDPVSWVEQGLQWKWN